MSFQKILSQLTSSPGAQGALGGAASGALVSMLVNKKARKKLGKTAVTVGGAAAVAGVGYWAYQKWKNGRETGAAFHSGVAPTQATPTPQLPEPEIRESLARAMVLAMIAAASADGQIDDAEMQRLMDALEAPELTPGEKAELTAALGNPPTVEDLALLASSPEEAAEIYGAALSAIVADNPSEVFFLKRLGSALKLDPELTRSINVQV